MSTTVLKIRNFTISLKPNDIGKNICIIDPSPSDEDIKFIINELTNRYHDLNIKLGEEINTVNLQCIHSNQELRDRNSHLEHEINELEELLKTLLQQYDSLNIEFHEFKAETNIKFNELNSTIDKLRYAVGYLMNEINLIKEHMSQK